MKDNCQLQECALVHTVIAADGASENAFHGYFQQVLFDVPTDFGMRFGAERRTFVGPCPFVREHVKNVIVSGSQA